MENRFGTPRRAAARLARKSIAQQVLTKRKYSILPENYFQFEQDTKELAEAIDNICLNEEEATDADKENVEQQQDHHHQNYNDTVKLFEEEVTDDVFISNDSDCEGEKEKEEKQKNKDDQRKNDEPVNTTITLLKCMPEKQLSPKIKPVKIDAPSELISDDEPEPAETSTRDHQNPQPVDLNCSNDTFVVTNNSDPKQPPTQKTPQSKTPRKSLLKFPLRKSLAPVEAKPETEKPKVDMSRIDRLAQPRKPTFKKGTEATANPAAATSRIKTNSGDKKKVFKFSKKPNSQPKNLTNSTKPKVDVKLANQKWNTKPGPQAPSNHQNNTRPPAKNILKPITGNQMTANHHQILIKPKFNSTPFHKPVESKLGQIKSSNNKENIKLGWNTKPASNQGSLKKSNQINPFQYQAAVAGSHALANANSIGKPTARKTLAEIRKEESARARAMVKDRRNQMKKKKKNMVNVLTKEIEKDNKKKDVAEIRSTIISKKRQSLGMSIVIID